MCMMISAVIRKGKKNWYVPIFMMNFVDMSRPKQASHVDLCVKSVLHRKTRKQQKYKKFLYCRRKS